MKERWHGIAALALGAAIVTGGVIGVSANEQGAGAPERPALSANSTWGRAHQFAERFGSEESEETEATVSPGTIDDGEELLPQAGITVDAAIASAQGAASGSIGEIDLEEYQGVLVFNVDVGDQDVKVDARTGEVLGMGED